MNNKWICENCGNLEEINDEYKCNDNDNFDFDVEFVVKCNKFIFSKDKNNN